MTGSTARGVRSVVVGLMLGLVAFGTTPAGAADAPTLTSTDVSATVSGFSVTATTTVRSSSAVQVGQVGVCVRNAARANFDFVKAQNVTVTPDGYSYTATQTFAAGSYTYWTCAYLGKTWLTLNAAKPFVVTGAKPADRADFIPVPAGDLTGWRQIFTDDFNTPAAAGTFDQVYKRKFSNYDGFADTYNGGTYNSDIVSVANGVLDVNLHTRNGRPQVAAIAPILGSPWKGQTYGKYSVRFRADALAGYKTAWLLWPDSNQWNQGEIDFPEGDLTGKMWAFNHCLGNPTRNCSWVDTQVTYTAWHTLSLEWTPTRVTYLIDGQVVGNDVTNIPSDPLHWVLQTETNGRNVVAQDGRLQIDWVSVYAWDPKATDAAAVVSGTTPAVRTTTAEGAVIETASAWKRVG